MNMRNMPQMIFPAVTICNENAFKYTLIDRCDAELGQLSKIQTDLSDDSLDYVKNVSQSIIPNKL